MKIVYSPSKPFEKNTALFRMLKAKFNLDKGEALLLNRNDPRLLIAAENLLERSGGMSFLVIKEIDPSVPFQIVGHFKELLVTGIPAKSSIETQDLDQVLQHYPVTLESADLTRPCIYSRDLGVLYVHSGAHHEVMMRLLECHLKMSSSELKTHLKSINMQVGEFFLTKIKGACFRSGASKRFTIADAANLNPVEYELISPFGFDEIYR